MDAIILAGALNSGPLRDLSPAQYEAEIIIAGRPMLDYVICALESVPEIRRILVVGHEQMISEDVRTRVDLVAEPGDSAIDSLSNGLQALASEEPVLIITSDVPLITREALEDFLERCRQRRGDLFYSFVPKEINEQKYPGVRRTYVKLAEGTYTGGNLALLSPVAVKGNIELLKKATILRKQPIKLCKMLGWRYLLKLIFGRLKISQIEERISAVLHFKAVGIISPFPEIGIDVDKPSDLRLAQEVLSK